MDLRQIIQNFNDGDWEDISPIFNRKITTFLKFLKGKNLLDRIDINQIPEDDFPEMEFLDSLGLLDGLEYRSVPDEASNKFLLYKLEKTPKETLSFICDDLLSDVELRGEDYYLRLTDREELSQFFKDYGRSTSPRDVAKSVLGEDDIFEPYWDTTNDVYRDVIEVLDKENLEVISHYIVDRIGNQVLSIDDYETEFFDSISNESGEFTITTENVGELLRDEESMKLLLNDDLDDLKQELYSLHSNSYNSAYESEIYDDVRSELERLFVGDITEEQSTKNDRTYYTPYIKIRDFYNDVHRFLSSFEGSGYNEDNLDYHGSYTEMIKHLMDSEIMDYLDFRIPDYPDYREVEKNINDMLSDYI
jgi:hypothetical protein